MSDSEIIWKFLQREYDDSHPVVYLYVMGQAGSRQTAINKIMNLTKIIFCPFIDENYVLVVVKAFLNDKKLKYKKGEIKVKSIY